MTLRLCMIVLMLLCAGAGPASSPSVASQTGTFELTFDHRSATSAIKEQLRRFGWRWESIHTAKDEPDYDLSNESFQVRVPDAYLTDPGGWGLLVWASPSRTGGVPRREWEDVLDKHKLIWIGANNVGNERAVWCRVGLAIDAATNLQKQYAIEPSRIYIAGMSGGGKVASLVGLAYPDLFTGGIYCCGTSFYRDIEAPPAPGEHPSPNQRRLYPRACFPPPLKLLTMTKEQSAHVLLTGENDINRDPTQAMFQKGFQLDHFKHATYIEVPHMRHELPPAQWFEKAIEFLDATSSQRSATERRRGSS